MNDDEAKTLGMRAKALPGFSWQPRMMNGRSALTVRAIDRDDDEREIEVLVVWDEWPGGRDDKWRAFNDDDWPDFRDPPTMGWLHRLAEDAADAYVEVWLDTSCGFKAHLWKGESVPVTLGSDEGGYTSEIETWIAVLEDAAKR